MTVVDIDCTGSFSRHHYRIQKHDLSSNVLMNMRFIISLVKFHIIINIVNMIVISDMRSMWPSRMWTISSKFQTHSLCKWQPCCPVEASQHSVPSTKYDHSWQIRLTEKMVSFVCVSILGHEIMIIICTWTKPVSHFDNLHFNIEVVLKYFGTIKE